MYATLPVQSTAEGVAEAFTLLSAAMAWTAIVCVWSLAVVFYVLGAIGLGRVCANAGIEKTWRAWAPFVHLYAMGLVGEKLRGPESRFRLSVWMLSSVSLSVTVGLLGLAALRVPRFGAFFALPLLGLSLMLLAAGRLMYLYVFCLFLRAAAPKSVAALILIALFLPGSERLVLFVLRDRPLFATADGEETEAAVLPAGGVSEVDGADAQDNERGDPYSYDF